MRTVPAHLILAALCASTAGAAQAGYRFQEEPRALTFDTSRVALMPAPRLAGSGAPDWQTLGLRPEDVSPFPIAGWWLAETPRELRRPEALLDWCFELSVREELAFVSPVFFGEDGGPLFPTPVLLVRFGSDCPPGRARALLAECGTVLEEDWAGMTGAYRVRCAARDGQSVLDQANLLALRPEVEFAEPDMVFTGRGGLIPNDPGFGDCWGLHNTGQTGGTPDMDMDAPEAWEVTTGDGSILVAVLDTGVQMGHPDLNQAPGTDTTSQGPGDGGPVNACDNHGTAVAGCVSALIDNGIGTAGSAPGCRSASARTFISSLDCSGSWTSVSSWTVDSLAWAESIGARVSNNSNYYGFMSNSIATKYRETRDAGMVHFAIAGNFGSPSLVYPGSLSSVNAVAALDHEGILASFSSFGAGLAYSAPGVSIYSTDRTGSAGYTSGDFASVSGTSFASPYAAGAAALLLSVNPLLSAACVEQILADGAVDRGALGYDTQYGWGFVNLAAAVDGVTPPDSILLTAPPTAPVGQPLACEWSQAPADAPYLLYASRRANGLELDCQPFDLGPGLKLLAAGLNSPAGTGDYASPPVPGRLAGKTFYLELRADSGGRVYDSNLVQVTVP